MTTPLTPESQVSVYRINQQRGNHGGYGYVYTTYNTICQNEERVIKEFCPDGIIELDRNVKNEITVEDEDIETWANLKFDYRSHCNCLVEKFKNEEFQLESMPKFYETINDNNTVYFVMTSFTGTTLKNKSPLTGVNQWLLKANDKDIVNVFLPLINDLVKLHEIHQIIHCDISPDNIIFDTQEKGTPILRLIDFGACIFKGHDNYHEICKKPSYSPPEILLDKCPWHEYDEKNGEHICKLAKSKPCSNPAYCADRITPQVDIYSICATMYYCFTLSHQLKKPENANNHVVQTRDTPDYNMIREIPSLEKQGVSKEISDIIAKGMSRDPSERYSSMSKLAHALELTVSSKRKCRAVISQQNAIKKTVAFLSIALILIVAVLVLPPLFRRDPVQMTEALFPLNPAIEGEGLESSQAANQVIQQTSSNDYSSGIQAEELIGIISNDQVEDTAIAANIALPKPTEVMLTPAPVTFLEPSVNEYSTEEISEHFLYIEGINADDAPNTLTSTIYKKTYSAQNACDGDETNTSWQSVFNDKKKGLPCITLHLPEPSSLSAIEIFNGGIKKPYNAEDAYRRNARAHELSIFFYDEDNIECHKPYTVELNDEPSRLSSDIIDFPTVHGVSIVKIEISSIYPGMENENELIIREIKFLKRINGTQSMDLSEDSDLPILKGQGQPTRIKLSVSRSNYVYGNSGPGEKYYGKYTYYQDLVLSSVALMKTGSYIMVDIQSTNAQPRILFFPSDQFEEVSNIPDLQEYSGITSTTNCVTLPYFGPGLEYDVMPIENTLQPTGSIVTAFFAKDNWVYCAFTCNDCMTTGYGWFPINHLVSYPKYDIGTDESWYCIRCGQHGNDSILCSYCNKPKLKQINYFNGAFNEKLMWAIADKQLYIAGNGYIPDYDFNNAPWLKGNTHFDAVIIQEGITGIGENAFYGCLMRSIQLPSSLRRINDSAFEFCNNLQTLSLPEGLTYIGEDFVFHCSSLEKLELPSTLVIFSEGAVSVGCTLLRNISIPESNPYYCVKDGVLFDRAMQTLICHPAGLGDNVYTIPNTVKWIGAFAFSYNSQLTDITLPASVVSIGRQAFFHSTSLQCVSMTDSVLNIDEHAFSECTSLKDIRLSDSFSSYICPVFDYDYELREIFLPRYLQIIGSSILDNNTNLEKIHIPSTVQSIDADSFINCPNLTIYCEEGSYAQFFATQNSIPYAIDTYYSDEASTPSSIPSVVNEDFFILCSF